MGMSCLKAFNQMEIVLSKPAEKSQRVLAKFARMAKIGGRHRGSVDLNARQHLGLLQPHRFEFVDGDHFRRRDA
jgi:hypothetical protein